MKAMKIIYQILYIIFGIGWCLAVSPGIQKVYTTGRFQVFDSFPYSGIEAYFQAILLYSFFYLFVGWIPLFPAVILHAVYKLKSENQHQKG